MKNYLMKDYIRFQTIKNYQKLINKKLKKLNLQIINMEMEMNDLRKIKECNGNPKIDNQETEKILKIYLDVHRNKSCPPYLFNIIITIIILFVLIFLIIISNV